MTTLFYIHDPMCSWCWAYQPVLQQITQQLKNHPISVKKIVGGLAPDNDALMPLSQQKQLQAIWKKIAAELDTPFNFAFWKDCEPRRSSYAACRAVIASRVQHAEDAMILAIQKAYYLRAMNPSDDDTLLQLADELALDFAQFEHDFYHADTQAQLLQEVDLAQRLPIQGFPSWVLAHQQQFIPISLDYHSHSTTLAALGQAMKT